MNEAKTEVFRSAPVPKAVLSNALPAMLAMLMVLVYNLADTFFIGQTGDALQVAAVSLATPVFLIFMTLGTVFGIGGTSLISRCLGAGRAEYARHVCAFCFWGCIATGAALLVAMLAFMDPLLYAVGASSETFDFAKTYLVIIALCGPLAVLGNCFSNILRAEGQSARGMAGMVCIGLAQGVQPLFGYCTGARMEDRYRKCLHFSLAFAFGLSSGLTLLCYAFTGPIVGAFLENADAYSYAFEFSRILLSTSFLFGVFYVLLNALQAMGASTASLIVNLSRQGLIYLPALFILQSLLGVTGLLWAQPVADVLSLALEAVLYRRASRKLWGAGEKAAGEKAAEGKAAGEKTAGGSADRKLQSGATLQRSSR